MLFEHFVEHHKVLVQFQANRKRPGIVEMVFRETPDSKIIVIPIHLGLARELVRDLSETNEQVERRLDDFRKMRQLCVVPDDGD